MWIEALAISMRFLRAQVRNPILEVQWASSFDAVLALSRLDKALQWLLSQVPRSPFVESVGMKLEGLAPSSSRTKITLSSMADSSPPLLLHSEGASWRWFFMTHRFCSLHMLAEHRRTDASHSSPSLRDILEVTATSQVESEKKVNQRSW